MIVHTQATVMECLETSQKSPAFSVCVATYLLRLADAPTWLRQQTAMIGRLLLRRYTVEQASADEK